MVVVQQRRNLQPGPDDGHVKPVSNVSLCYWDQTRSTIALQEWKENRDRAKIARELLHTSVCDHCPRGYR